MYNQRPKNGADQLAESGKAIKKYIGVISLRACISNSRSSTW